MKRHTASLRFAILALFALTALVASPSTAQDAPTKEAPKREKKSDQESEAKDKKKVEPFVIQVADDNIDFTVTGTWKKIKPRNRIIEVEIQVPRVKGDSEDGRLTIMGAGGTIQANIDRWEKQFSSIDMKDEKKMMSVEAKKVNGQSVTMVDIQGTFMDAPGGPFSGKPKVERPKYRMLAAIIQTENDGNYFVKLYGPQKTLKENLPHYKKMIESVSVAD